MKEKLTRELCEQKHKQSNLDYFDYKINSINQSLIENLYFGGYVRESCINEIKTHYQNLGYYIFDNGIGYLQISLNKPEIKEEKKTLFERFIDKLINLISK